MKKRGYRKIVGNALMAFSLLFILFIYYPLIKIYLFPPEIDQSIIDTSAFSISIPRIKVASNVISNVDAFDKSIYLEALQRGIAHAKGTSLPGEGGTSFLFAHSSDSPWNLTRYNTIFLKLGQLENKDRINIRRDGKEYVYSVYDKKTVWPNEVEFLTRSQGEDVLVLQTCSPIGTALKRTLIFAELI